MKTIIDLINLIKDDSYKDYLIKLYGNDDNVINRQFTRYKNAINNFLKNFDSIGGIKIFSSPGRIELCGNHTDHNGGMVLSSSINLDIIGIAQKNDLDEVNIISDGYKNPIRFKISNLKSNSKDEKSVSLVKGLFKGFKNDGFKIGGINVYTTSNILKGSGISSSAAFEMLICTMVNNFYNANKISIVELSKIGQYAENFYWKKPSGLLDQIACGYGGIISIDFKNSGKPKIVKIKNFFKTNDYDILLINTGGSHSDLTKEYASIPEEMYMAAKALKGKKLIDVKANDIINKAALLRKKTGDRALLRSIHFFNENQRVIDAIDVVNKNKIKDFLKIIKESGDSSWKYLQNCYIGNDSFNQNITLALALTDNFLNKKCDFASRVHGGGFAGVILVILPNNITLEYVKFIEKIFGKNSVLKINIRDFGAVSINKI